MSKVPAHAERVHKGIVFDVFQWKQELFDGTSATFEMLKRRNTLVVIPVGTDGQVYYSWQEQPGRSPFLGLFGGRAEEGEAPLETAKRELLEETGMEADEWIPFHVHRTPGKLEWEIHYYIAKGCKKVAEQALDAGEKVEIRSAPVDKFVNEIVADQSFAEPELRARLFSAFNPTEAEVLKKALS